MENAFDIWQGMPEFKQEKQRPYHHIIAHCGEQRVNIRFENQDHLDDFNSIMGFEFTHDDKEFRFDSPEKLQEQMGQKITNKTKSIWHPKLVRGLNSGKRWVSEHSLPLKYPVYIVSKGRASNGLTWKALDRCGVDYFVVCEEFEFELYSEVVGAERCLILPPSYLADYDTCDDLGDTVSKGPGAARNFCMDHSRKNGYKRHWVMDDNLDDFHRIHLNLKVPVRTPNGFRACEDFVDRFDNVPVAGLNYYSFCKSTDAVPPLVANTRIYSCLLIDSNAGYNWRGRYNEDTDLSLRVLKDGLCTIQFNAFVCGKVTTQRMRGGNSKEFYDGEGTLPKSKMIEDLHPDVSTVVWKFNRWHHLVDYKPFKSNELEQSVRVYGVDNYGMRLIDGVQGK